MALYLTETRIGNVVDIVAHSKANPKDGTRAKREKQKHTTLAQQARNDKGSIQYMALVALGNFSRRDLYLTFTYDDYNHPPNVKAVKADGERLMRRLRAMWPQLGVELKYIRVIEGLTDGKRYHHHMIVNAPGKLNLSALKAVLGKLWTAGAVHTERIGSKPRRTAYDLAFYFGKECRAFGSRAGEKGFSCSKNLDRGQSRTVLVPDNAAIDIPDGIPSGNILEKDCREVLYSRYVHLRYIVPSAPAKGRRKAGKGVSARGGNRAGANNN